MLPLSGLEGRYKVLICLAFVGKVGQPPSSHGVSDRLDDVLQQLLVCGFISRLSTFSRSCIFRFQLTFSLLTGKDHAAVEASGGRYLRQVQVLLARILWNLNVFIILFAQYIFWELVKHVNSINLFCCFNRYCWAQSKLSPSQHLEDLLCGQRMEQAPNNSPDQPHFSDYGRALLRWSTCHMNVTDLLSHGCFPPCWHVALWCLGNQFLQFYFDWTRVESRALSTDI